MRQEIPFTDAELKALAAKIKRGEEYPDVIDLLTEAEVSRLEALTAVAPSPAAPPDSFLNGLAERTLPFTSLAEAKELGKMGDGSPAAMCGNAALCSTRLARYLELAHGGGMTLVTGAGLVRTRCVGQGSLAEINLPACDLPVALDLEARPGESGFYFATVGVPHLIVLTDDARAVDVAGRGRELRSHPTLGPAGANVNFVSPSAGSRSDPWLIRTYERGVEGETLGCGTGTVAAGFALAVGNVGELPGEWQTSRGVRLGVSGSMAGGKTEEAWLLGEGRLVFTGILT